MKSILFVDDEPNVLSGLQRMLRPMRKHWNMSFVGDGKSALAYMAKEHVDVIVSDMRMPGMDGPTLLKEVMRLYPQVVRFALSGQSVDENMLRLSGPIHQFLSKPCNPDILKETVERAFSLRSMLSDEKLVRLVSGFNMLPVLPKAHMDLLDQLNTPDISLKTVARFIERDVGMSAKTLQWVNSAYFGVRNHVTSISYAVSLLGLDIIRSMVLTMGIFTDYEQAQLATGFSLESFVDHSIAVGAYARRIALAHNSDERFAADAFTGGVLHDAGKLILAAGCPREYELVISSPITSTAEFLAAEHEYLGADHAEVGGYLMGLWGFPDPIVEAVAYHHYPPFCLARGFTPLAAVHAANYVAHSQSNPNSNLANLDHAYCRRAGLNPERLAAFGTGMDTMGGPSL